MKRFAPLLFPVAAVIIIFLLLFRWYSMRTAQVAEPVEFGEGVEIENLSESELDSVLRGTDDVETIRLEPPAADPAATPGQTTPGQTTPPGSERAPGPDGTQAPAMGEIRYEIIGDRLNFSVIAQLPTLATGQYQVFLRQLDGQGVRKAFTLAADKGGYLGSAALSTELLPFEVIVTREDQPLDATPEEVLLRGVIQRPADASASPEAAASPAATADPEVTPSVGASPAAVE